MQTKENKRHKTNQIYLTTFVSKLRTKTDCRTESDIGHDPGC